MGQKDTVTKDYIRNAEVFADAFNYLLYEGEKIITELSDKEIYERLHIIPADLQRSIRYSKN